jgi:hypothetical protein
MYRDCVWRHGKPVLTEIRGTEIRGTEIRGTEIRGREIYTDFA